jgi:DNA-directed RNA polymerase subunit RPC12/RpoP
MLFDNRGVLMLTTIQTPDGKPVYQCDNCGKDVMAQDIIVTFSGDFCPECHAKQQKEKSS